jgi:hypothetical protein
MPWIRERAVGTHAVAVCYSRTGGYHRRFGRSQYPEEGFRVSGRHLRLVIRPRDTEKTPTWAG